jgi:hypothetical protein
MAAPVVRAATRQNDKTATEAIAKDTDTAIEQVQEIYERELTTLANDAKITQFLGVLATRRVKLLLRKH